MMQIKFPVREQEVIDEISPTRFELDDKYVSFHGCVPALLLRVRLNKSYNINGIIYAAEL